MHYGIEVVPFGDFSSPLQIVQLAQAAEAAGWEGLWIWDHVLVPYGVGDPWITLAAVAVSTKSIKLCAGVSPLPRYRPHLLARTLVGLDLLSTGRIIFASGLGVTTDFAPFGEPADDKVRAAMLDEGLELLAGYLSGEEINFEGKLLFGTGSPPGAFPHTETTPTILDWGWEQTRPASCCPMGWMDHGHRQREE